jgi:hypothetical protein
MAKRNSRVTRENGRSATSAPTVDPANALEQRVLAFAKQAGYVAGTIQLKAEGWMDRKALTKQLASVRDGATQLLEQLGNVAHLSRKKPVAPPKRKATRTRSGGAVDAPGKKHRKRPPADPDAALARSQAEKMRSARTMEKARRPQARG